MSFLLTIFFYVTKYCKIWKTIFIEGFSAKQIERYIQIYVDDILLTMIKILQDKFALKDLGKLDTLQYFSVFI